MSAALPFLLLLAFVQAEPVIVTPGQPFAMPAPPIMRPPPIITVPTAPPNYHSTPVMSPIEAVMRTASVAPAGIAGSFGFRIEAAAMVGPTLFLNSERDYRDQRNLSLEVAPAVLAGLKAKFGSDLTTGLRGRLIVVDGVARRVRIDFLINDRPSGKYYYQTHVRVDDPRQIRVLG